MNNEYLARAREVVPDAKTLILLASKRARQLAYGAHPMIRCKDENYLDVALLEIAEHKLEAVWGEEVEKDSFIELVKEAKAAAGTADPDSL